MPQDMPPKLMLSTRDSPLPIRKTEESTLTSPSGRNSEIARIVLTDEGCSLPVTGDWAILSCMTMSGLQEDNKF